jgi:putative heme iron utilization protein
MERKSDFDPQNAAKKLLREGRSGALATLMAGSGGPYCSLVNVATAADGAPLLLLSRLALHTKNILADPRVSLMIDERKPGDPLEGARVMLMGRAEATEDPEARRRYLDRQPEAEAFAGFGDFDLKPQDILIDLAGMEALVAAEADVVAHMNRDHRDAARLYATRLLGARDGDWRCAGYDPEGLELQDGRTALRLTFPRRVDEPGMLRHVLKQLVDRARAA